MVYRRAHPRQEDSMKTQPTQRNLIAGAAVAIAVALVGGAVFAAVPGTSGEISACYNRSGKCG